MDQDEEHRRAADDAAEQEPDCRMQVAELAEKDGEHHDAGNDGKLGGLEIDRTKLDPASRTVDFGADEAGENEEGYAAEIHGERTPFDPAVIDEAGDEKDDHADADPDGLSAPEF